MKYLAAYLLLTQGGNATPAAADIKTIVESVGIEADEARINELLSSLEGKGSLDEIIAAGAAKFASAPAAAGASAAGASGEAAAEAAEEEAKEESDDDMGFGLFD